MNFIRSSIPIALAVFLLGACSPLKYMVDYDNGADFSRYKTYNFTPASDSIPMNQLNKRRLFNAVSNEMNENGIRWNAVPDLYVHIHILMKGRTRTNVIYGHGETVNLGSGFSTTYMDLSEYSEGSVFIDLIDAGRKQMVWTGKVTGDIKSQDMIKEKDIQNIVQKLFRKFPPGKPE